ncbi:MAG TPA: hypothetical protein DGT23_04135 [Micromonosporaceae bacterium]|nr:hypothetical protein [Micromonosporaceae bacterium]
MLAGVISLAAAAGIGIVGGTLTEAASTPQPAHASSSIGGYITRTEVLSRAQWWIDTYGAIYSQDQADAKPDPQGQRYRPDCSGFVSMAWHLPKKSNGWDRYTGDLADFGDTTYLGSLSDLKPGDAILGETYGHVALFDKWVDAGKTRMWIYDEYSTGDPGRHTIIDRSWYADRGFRGLRYNKITSGNRVSDYTGDGISDIAVFRPSTGEWIRQGSVMLTGWGGPGDIPLSGDYTGDGKSDIAVFRPSTGQWIRQGHVMLSGWGGPGDIPLSGDYTGDGITDIAVFRPSTGEWIRQGHVMLTGWGGPGDIPLSGDYNGDGITDIAVYRPSTGEWIRQGAIMASNWGEPGDIPLSGDYNGDGYSDIAVYRPSNGSWIKLGATMLTGWGNSTDLPTAGSYYTSSGSCGMAMAQSAGPVC